MKISYINICAICGGLISIGAFCFQAVRINIKYIQILIYTNAQDYLKNHCFILSLLFMHVQV